MIDTLLWVAGKMVFPLLNPYLLLFLVLCLVLGLMVVGLSVWARRLLSGLMALWLIVAVFDPGRWVLWHLEQSTPPSGPLEGEIDGIIVLGGAVGVSLSEAQGRPEVSGNADRLLAFAELVVDHPNATAIYTGGNGGLHDRHLREADVARDVLERLDVPVERINFEGESRNSWENATLSLPIAQPSAGEAWIMITSARHMPRALGAFAAAGWPPIIPYPVDYGMEFAPPKLLTFNPGGSLGRIRNASYEVLGLAWYWMTGRWEEPTIAE